MASPQAEPQTNETKPRTKLSLKYPLDISHLDIVLDALKPIEKSKWQLLGLKLGLLQPTLDTIEANYKQDVERCLKECLSKWLRRVDEVDECGHPTLSRLADALEEIEDKATAERIRNTLKKQNDEVDSVQSLSTTAATNKKIEVEPLPYDLKSAYVEMNGEFADLLLYIIKEMMKHTPLEDIKQYLLAFENNVKEEVEAVENINSLITYLRKRCYLSNFSLLKALIKSRNLKFENPQLLKEEIEKFNEERDSFYKKILATDFARHAISDHRTCQGQREMECTVSWKFETTTLKEFEDFLNGFFQEYRIHISLTSVHHSLLTFVCTIPSWLVSEMIVFVKKIKESLKGKGIVEISVDGYIIPIDPVINWDPFLPADVPLFNTRPFLHNEEIDSALSEITEYLYTSNSWREAFIKIMIEHKDAFLPKLLTILKFENSFSIRWSASLPEKETKDIISELQAAFQKFLANFKRWITHQLTQQQDSKRLLFQIAKEAEVFVAVEGLSDIQLTNADELIIELHPYCSYLNFNLIEHLIVNVVPDLNVELKIAAAEYSKRLQYFKSSSQLRYVIKAIPKPVNQKTHSNMTSVWLSFHSKWNDMSLHNLLTITNYFLGLKRLHLNHIISGKDKGVRAKFLLHNTQVETFKTLSEYYSENLIQLGLKNITIDGKSLFPDTEISKEMDLEKACLQAAKNGNFSLFLPLFELGVSLDCTDENKETPLMLGVKNGNENVVKVLLALGADVHMSNAEGYTPLMIAYDRKQDDIIQLLRSAVAKANLRESGPLRQKSIYVQIPEEDHIISSADDQKEHEGVTEDSTALIQDTENDDTLIKDETEETTVTESTDESNIKEDSTTDENITDTITMSETIQEGDTQTEDNIISSDYIISHETDEDSLSYSSGSHHELLSKEEAGQSVIEKEPTDAETHQNDDAAQSVKESNVALEESSIVREKELPKSTEDITKDSTTTIDDTTGTIASTGSLDTSEYEYTKSLPDARSLPDTSTGSSPDARSLPDTSTGSLPDTRSLPNTSTGSLPDTSVSLPDTRSLPSPKAKPSPTHSGKTDEFIEVYVQSEKELKEKHPQLLEYRKVRFQSKSVDTVNLFLLKAQESKMTHISFIDTRLKKESIQELSKLISTSTTLEDLELVHSGEKAGKEPFRFSSESIDIICQSLCDNTFIKSVAIRSCELDTDGIYTLVDMLVCNSNITKLTLDSQYEHVCKGNSYYIDEPDVKEKLFFV